MKQERHSERKFPLDLPAGNPLRVALFVGKGIVSPHIIEDIALAFKQLDCAVEFIPLNVSMRDLSDKIAKVRPDFVMGLDGKGLDYSPLVEAKIKRVAWFVDNPGYFQEEATLTHDDIIFVWDKDYINDLTSAGFKHVHFLPLATNPQRFSFSRLSHEDEEIYSCDVSFVGTIGKKVGELVQERKEKYPPVINTFVEKMIELVLQLYDKRKYRNVLAGMRLTESSLNSSMRSLIQLLVDIEVNAIKRHGLLEILTDYKSICYGDAREQAGANKGVRLAPPVDYSTELAKVFKGSTINLNITRPQLRTTVNQRVFDVFSCGGFLLTDYREYLDEVLPFDAELISFSNFQDLNSKIEYFLKHKDERQELTQAAQDAIRRKHTYLHRMEELLSIVQPILQN